MTAVVVPQWTEQLYVPVGGQDHLGVGSVVTDRILPQLSPGINVLTPHPRYWSFYAFVVDEFWRRDLPRTSAAFRGFMRRKEAIFAIGGHLCRDPDHRATPIGNRRVQPLVDDSPSTYRADFNYMKSAGGGYGLYYATVMQTTGVVRLADRSAGLPVDTITPAVGRQLAEAFRDAISGTRYWRKYFDADRVPAEVVEEYGNVACLCRLRAGAADRDPLVDVFLHGGPQATASARRTTLRLILELAAQTNGVGISQDDFRRLMLDRDAYDPESDELIASFEPPDVLVSSARRWRLSQLREMFNWSLNSMWAWVTQWGLDRNGDTFSIPISDLDDAIDGIDLRVAPGIRVSLSSLIERLVDQCRSAAQMTDSLDGRWELWTDLTEDALYVADRDGDLDRGEELGALFVLYVMTLARLWEPQLPVAVGALDWAPVREGGLRRVGMQYALEQLRQDVRSGKTVREVLHRIVEQHVIAQHERVALAKLPDDTYRFRRELGRLRFFDQSTVFRPNDSRFNALSTTVAELGWSGYFEDENHALANEGEQIRASGDFEAESAT